MTKASKPQNTNQKPSATLSAQDMGEAIITCGDHSIKLLAGYSAAIRCEQAYGMDLDLWLAMRGKSRPGMAEICFLLQTPDTDFTVNEIWKHFVNHPRKAMKGGFIQQFMMATATIAGQEYQEALGTYLEETDAAFDEDAPKKS